jgi:uncharacterized membrane protein
MPHHPPDFPLRPQPGSTLAVDHPPASAPPPLSPTQRLTSLIGHGVQWTTLALAALGCVGLVIYLSRHGAAPASFEHLRTFTGEPADWRSLRDIVRFDASMLSGRGLGQLAVALLLIVPVFRVAASVLIFRRDGDHLHTRLTLLLLLILLFGLFFKH